MNNPLLPIVCQWLDNNFPRQGAKLRKRCHCNERPTISLEDVFIKYAMLLAEFRYTKAKKRKLSEIVTQIGTDEPKHKKKCFEESRFSQTDKQSVDKTNDISEKLLDMEIKDDEDRSEMKEPMEVDASAKVIDSTGSSWTTKDNAVKATISDDSSSSSDDSSSSSSEIAIKTSQTETKIVVKSDPDSDDSSLDEEASKVVSASSKAVGKSDSDSESDSSTSSSSSSTSSSSEDEKVNKVVKSHTKTALVSSLDGSTSSSSSSSSSSEDEKVNRIVKSDTKTALGSSSVDSPSDVKFEEKLENSSSSSSSSSSESSSGDDNTSSSDSDTESSSSESDDESSSSTSDDESSSSDSSDDESSSSDSSDDESLLTEDIRSRKSFVKKQIPSGNNQGKKKKAKRNKRVKKRNKPFQRVQAEKVKFLNKNLRDNSYNKAESFGFKASEKLLAVKGKNFMKSKNKHKKMTYFGGGRIDMGVRSVKIS